jgi:hypothetical protein
VGVFSYLWCFRRGFARNSESTSAPIYFGCAFMYQFIPDQPPGYPTFFGNFTCFCYFCVIFSPTFEVTLLQSFIPLICRPICPQKSSRNAFSANSRAGLSPNALVKPALGAGTRAMTSSEMLSIDGCANHAQSSIGHRLRASMLPVYRTFVTTCGVIII